MQRLLSREGVTGRKRGVKPPPIASPAVAYNEIMEHHNHDRSAAERAFRESLERLRETLENPPPKQAASEVPPSPANEAELWEDAIDDIERFLNARHPQDSDSE
ncbi:hypothetical protein [Baaleninema sp.]|uniref:hypothetical protein n=1 Tax=Baaleninema sp. TaxID=3101197 RepID=UPI003D04272F